MNIAGLIEILPDSVKLDIVDFTSVTLKTGKPAIRIMMDRLLTDSEKDKMRSKQIIGLDCVAYYKYAPEIKKSYFYLEA